MLNQKTKEFVDQTKPKQTIFDETQGNFREDRTK